MKRPHYFYLICIVSIIFTSCKKDDRTSSEYFDVMNLDAVLDTPLIAVTDDELLQNGSRVAYIDPSGDTVIPFGHFAYSGTDTLAYYANVIELAADGRHKRHIAINNDQKILFEVVLFDNGPDYFNNGLTRVKRNGKMGYANKYGQVVIPCIYDYARPFNNGKAKVTFKTKVSSDTDEHKQVESDKWFEIDNLGNKIE